jgi:hypothetical protein
VRSSLASLLASLVVLAACDLQPAPKSVPAPAANRAANEPPPPPPGAVAPTPPAPPPSDAGIVRAPADALIDVSAACVEVGSHVAAILIAEAKDPSQSAALEQGRTKIVRATAEACTRDAWSDAAKTCFLQAKTSAALQVCGTNLKAP